MTRHLNPNLKIGTCSWKYDSWKGLVYSDDVGKAYLKEYAQHYDLVEVDQWFWSLFGEKIVMPKPDVVREYVQSVPEHFRFSIKVPNAVTLTHHPGNGPLKVNDHFLSNTLMSDFIDLLSPMRKQINSFIFQFGYLNRQKMPNQKALMNRLEDFCSQLPSGFHYAIEIRNPNYLNKTWFEFLESHYLSHVFLQGYWMPPIFEIFQKHKQRINRHTVIRLHGPDRKEIEKRTQKKWNTRIAPKDEELHLLKIMIEDLLSKGVKVTLNVNNHYEGSAPMTIDRIKNLFQ